MEDDSALCSLYVVYQPGFLKWSYFGTGLVGFVSCAFFHSFIPLVNQM